MGKRERRAVCGVRNRGMAAADGRVVLVGPAVPPPHVSLEAHEKRAAELPLGIRQRLSLANAQRRVDELTVRAPVGAMLRMATRAATQASLEPQPVRSSASRVTLNMTPP